MSKDFECLPLGTGAELARLNDLVQYLSESLADTTWYAELDIWDNHRNFGPERLKEIKEMIASAKSALAKAGL